MPTTGSRQLRFVRVLFFGPLFAGLAFAVVALLRDELHLVPFVLLMLFIRLTWGLMNLVARRGGQLQWFVSLGLLVSLLLVPEMGLRAMAFRHASGVEFGYPRPELFVHYERDPELFFVLDRSDPAVNSWGFRGPEIGPKTSGTLRVLFLGDSCTFAGEPPYPSMVEDMLNEAMHQASDSREVECVSLSIAGYTSHQGRVLAERYGAEVAPDVVVVFYGWNDHWLAYGAPDHEKQPPESPGLFEAAVGQLRLLQLIARFAGGDEPIDEVRVPPRQYRDNLSRLAGVFEATGVPVVFITAPSGHRKLGVDPALLQLKFAADAESVMALHDEYVEIVRDIVREVPVSRRLLDLNREFGELDTAALDALFTGDGIHFERAGMERVARRVTDALRVEFGVGK